MGKKGGERNASSDVPTMVLQYVFSVLRFVCVSPNTAPVHFWGMANPFYGSLYEGSDCVFTRILKGFGPNGQMAVGQKSVPKKSYWWGEKWTKSLWSLGVFVLTQWPNQSLIPVRNLQTAGLTTMKPPPLNSQQKHQNTCFWDTTKPHKP